MVIIIAIVGYSPIILAQENASYQLNQANIKGVRNGAFGYQALFSNTTGFANTATGSYALFSNTVGGNNTATGYKTLYSNTKGTGNVAVGEETMFSNNGGNYNSAIGFRALYYNIGGNYNTANGTYTLVANTSGNNNSATGFYALYNNTSGNYNTAMGDRALLTNITGNSNTALGYKADVTAPNAANGIVNNATAIGANAIVNASNKVRIGSATVTVVEGPVGYTVSDGRFKTNITDEVKGLEFIKLLRPVVYNFDTKMFENFLTKNMPDSISREYMNKDFGPSTAIRQTGFIAQEVEEAARKIKYDFNGVHLPENDNDNYSIAYAQFVVPLVKGMQEQQEMIEQLKSTNEQQQKQIDELKKLILINTTIKSANIEVNDIILNQNVPNPFAAQSDIAYNIPRNAKIAQIVIYNANGQEIKRNTITNRGEGKVNVAGNDLKSGVYNYSLIVDNKIITKQMIKL